MYKQLGNRLKSYPFDRQLRIFTTTFMLCTFGLFLIISTTSNVLAIMKQNEERAGEQVDALAAGLTDRFDYYHNLSTSVVIDEYVQQFCKGRSSLDEVSSKVFNSLSNYLNIDNNANFLIVKRLSDQKYIYRGSVSLAVTGVEKAFEQDYEKSHLARFRGSIRLNFSRNYFNGEKYTLTLYMPIYSTDNMIRETGLLMINFDDNILETIDGAFICDQEGRVFTASDKELIGTRLPWFSKLSRPTGSFIDSGQMISWNFTDKWNYCVIHSIPLWSLCRSSVKTALILVLLLILLIGASVVISGRMVKMMYAPIDTICSVMDRVSGGELEVSIPPDNMGEDLKEVALGFNSMMEQIILLMEQVKLEQHQLEQIRINALQAQIQPHFLYNTLECIHWQAASQGNTEVSALVKALAKYYRICLSKGKDIIPLETELEHIRNYIIIQNMRYDQIITLNIRVPEQYKDLQIPKLTLQPLIENSIYHGLKIKEGKSGTIWIDLTESGEAVTLFVSDSGNGMSRETIEEMNDSISAYKESFGYGVRNVHKRIELIFGSGYGLRFDSNASGGVTVNIRLPLKSNLNYENIL
ncbi:MAG: sensor histidine kinase [Hungatella sp.]|jgi:two-component system sensor histidine kinase YesM|nr:sensor histidine kinase [Hungatella sp.]